MPRLVLGGATVIAVSSEIAEPLTRKLPTGLSCWGVRLPEILRV
jgi:hypothetical protein